MKFWRDASRLGSFRDYKIEIKEFTYMEKEIAKALLEIGAVFLLPDEPFTWASGIKSPWSCPL